MSKAIKVRGHDGTDIWIRSDSVLGIWSENGVTHIASVFSDESHRPWITHSQTSKTDVARRLGWLKDDPAWMKKAKRLAPTQKIMAIKAVREGTGWGLREAKDLVDSWGRK